jgi:nicotinamide-nucleotide amidase
MIKQLLPLAEKVALRLIAQKQTIAVAESSTGGLIAASLLAVPGASSYFLGSAVVYTREARRVLMDITDAEMKGFRSSSEPYAELLARQMRGRLSSDWALSETGAAGPSGNRYGDAAGHTCIAVAGPKQAVMTLETASDDRIDNMQVFASTALTFLLHTMST